MEFGEIRSWCALPEEEFLKRLPYIIPTLRRIYEANPYRYTQEVTPYIAKHWKGMYFYDRWESGKILHKYLPEGKYGAVLECCGFDPEFRDSLGIVEDLTLLFKTRLGLKGFQEISRVARPKHLEIKADALAHIFKFGGMLSGLESFSFNRRGTTSHSEQVPWEKFLLKISQIPQVTLHDYRYDEEGHIFSDVIWETYSLNYDLQESIVDIFASSPGTILTQPYIKSLTSRIRNGEVIDHVDMRVLKEKFPSLDQIELLSYRAGQVGEILLPGGEWESIRLGGCHKVIFDSPVYINVCNLSMLQAIVGGKGGEGKINTLHAHALLFLKDAELIESFEVEHLILNHTPDPSLIPPCVKKLTLADDPDLKTMVSLCERFGDDFQISYR